MSGREPTPAPAPDLVTVRRRAVWPWLVVGLGVGAAATIGVQQLTDTDTADAATIRTETVGLSTAEVTTRDLIEYVDYDGELARGNSTSILATGSGVITSTMPIGDVVNRGTTVATVDAQPVSAFYGSLPFHRSLSYGDEGADVLQLEVNLWALGFTDDGDLTVDGEYGSSTTDAIEAWEASLGLDETGDFDSSRVVVVPGPSVVSEIAETGTQASAGQQLLLVQSMESWTDVTLSAQNLDDEAIIADLATVGTAVEQGTVLATIDGQSVFALTDASVISTEILDAFAADDVERLENLLVYFGFDPDAAIVVDDEADLATIAAVVRWQESIGLAPTGAIGSPYYVEVPAGLEVAEVSLADGDTIGAGRLAMALTAPTTSVAMDIVVDDLDDVAVGDGVEVILADEQVVQATIASIADTIEQSDDGTTPTVGIEITLIDPPLDLVVGPVTVRFTTSTISDATVIPTRALVSLAEGGFAVEVQVEGASQLTAVELGAFDDGVVEVVDGGVSPGDIVVVPT